MRVLYPDYRFIFLNLYRVRTGYGILEKLWNFEKEIPYMEKLWNFRLGGKKCVLSLKNRGKIYPDFNMWFQRLLLQLSLH